VRVDDMLEAIAKCLSYVEGMTAAAFEADSRTVDAVARNLEIIGEAANKMPRTIRDEHSLIPWDRIGEMRHVLIHEYHSVDPGILYRTVTDELPPLVPMLEAVLAEADRRDARDNAAQ
jgi:uncharacterized protein with HEPN domain